MAEIRSIPQIILAESKCPLSKFGLRAVQLGGVFMFLDSVAPDAQDDRWRHIYHMPLSPDACLTSTESRRYESNGLNGQNIPMSWRLMRIQVCYLPASERRIFHNAQTLAFDRHVVNTQFGHSAEKMAKPASLSRIFRY